MSSEQRTRGFMVKRLRTAKRKSSETMAAFPKGQSPLELLPDEIHLNIFEQMIPANTALHYTTDHQAHRAALRNLCRVSKRMGPLGRQALYCELRMYSHEKAIHLLATILRYPRLSAYVKSIIFHPSQDEERRESVLVDLRSLQSVNYPDFDYWTTGADPSRVRMPEVTRDKMVYNLLVKVLAQTPALQALYIRLPKNHARTSAQHFRRTANAKCLRELTRQNQLFAQASPPELPHLKTVGILGGDLHWQKRDSLFSCGMVPFFKSLLRLPGLVEVCWAGLPHERGRPELWDAPLITGHVGNVSAPPTRYVEMSTTVKSINIRSNRIEMNNIRGLAKAFPSVNTITVEDGYFSEIRYRVPEVPHELFGALEQFDNLHTLVLDNDPRGFATSLETETGVGKLVDLSALATLQALVVPLDLFAYFTLGENRLIQLATTILPDSLRRLTLLLNTECKKRLADLFTRKIGVDGVTSEFMQDLAASFLDQFPNLNKVEVCYHIDRYRMNDISTVADRSGTRAN